MRRAARNSISPYREGWNARYAGKSALACPYRNESDRELELEWRAGYAACDEQLAREGKK